MNPIKVKNTSNNRQIFKDLEFIYNEQQVVKIQRQILIQIRQQNKANKQSEAQPTQQSVEQQSPLNQNVKIDLAEDDLDEEMVGSPSAANNEELKAKQQLEQQSCSRNATYNYDYDVYKFYERNKTSLLLSSLQSKNKINRTAITAKPNAAKQNNSNSNNNLTSSNNMNNINNAITNNEIGDDEEEEELYEEEIENFNEERDDTGEQSDEWNNQTNKNLITKCES